MFQEHALFPWLTAGRNIELALRLRGVPKHERRSRGRGLLELVRLHGAYGKRVHELSGGMRQRVALARALAQDSQLLLMDEPFAALDAITRDVLHDELTRIWRETNLSVLFVTHNVREAVRLAQRVVLLSSRPGRVAREWTGGHPAAAPYRGRRSRGALRRDHRRTAWGDPPPWPALRRLRSRTPRPGRPRSRPRRAGNRPDPTARPVREVLVKKVLPPLTAVALVLVVWQILVSAQVTDSYKLPSPGAVWGEPDRRLAPGHAARLIWTSVSRGLLGFLLALVIGTPLGLLVARVKFVRAAIGPILSGLQSLPSVAWVPPAVIWLGLNDSMMYAVILLGAVPSIANGLVSGVDQVPPLYLRAGRTLGATGLRGAWHILMPAALPGYLAGLKQGWAFSWRSLMAAEIIASSPDLGVGLGQLLENGRNNPHMPWSSSRSS